MMPTASADPSVRASARARRAAPVRTAAPSTATDDAVTDAERRDGSRFLVPPNAIPLASLRTTTTSSPARSSTRSAAAPPRTTPPSPSSTASRRRSAPARPRAATTLPSASPGRSAARCSSLPHCAITAEASTVGRKGPGATWRPTSSSTTTSSLSPAPAPPCSSGRWMPNQPSWAMSFQKDGRGSESASSNARLAASAPWSARTLRTEAPSSWCSSVMAIGMPAPCSSVVVRRARSRSPRRPAARHYRTPGTPSPSGTLTAVR